MTIGIDCRLAGIGNAGIGRYIEELVRELVEDNRHNWVLFLARENQLPWLKTQKNIKLLIVPIRHYTLLEQLVMPLVFWREKLDLLHVPHFNVPLFYRGRFVVTIHDLLWHDQRGNHMTTLSPFVYFLKYFAYKLVSRSAILRSQKIFVPTQVVKKTIQSHIKNLNDDKIIVTYEGVDRNWTQHPPLAQGFVGHANTSEKILFYTGSLYPHKNLMLVVRALQFLPKYELYISSARNVFVSTFLQKVTRLGFGKRVHYLGRLTDDELRVWYQKSFALVQPSLSEGFGLTGIEAMAAGLPVLASDIPVFAEIYQNAYLSFDPHSEQDFVHAVKKLETCDRRKLILAAQVLVKQYSWKRMALETIEQYMLCHPKH